MLVLPGFLPPLVGMRAANASIGVLSNASSVSSCALACTGRADCISFNFDDAPNSTKCELNGWSDQYILASAGSTAGYWFRELAVEPASADVALVYPGVVPVEGVRLTPPIGWESGAPSASGSVLASAFSRNLVYLSQFKTDDMLFWFRFRAGNKTPPGESWGWDNGPVDAPYGLKGSIAGARARGREEEYRAVAQCSLPATRVRACACVRARVFMFCVGRCVSGSGCRYD